MGNSKKKNNTTNIIIIGLASKFLLNKYKINTKSFNNDWENNHGPKFYNQLKTIKKDTSTEIKDNYTIIKKNFINRFLNTLHLKPTNTEESDDNHTSEESDDNHTSEETNYSQENTNTTDRDYTNRYNDNATKSTSSRYEPRNINVTNSGTRYSYSK